MARVQVYLPDDLHREVKARALPVSRLLQDAVRAAIKREKLDREMDRYITELREEVGEPSKAERARAASWAKRVLGRGTGRSRKRAA